MLLFILFAFVLYYFLSVSYFEGLNAKYKTRFLALSCILVAYIIGIREPMHWSDSGGYFMEFIENVKPFSQLLPSDRSSLYSEMGFYYIGVLAKTISDDATFYFLLVSAITMFCLYYCFKQYSIFPFIALYVYLGRFVGRNTIQIRAAIAKIVEVSAGGFYCITVSYECLYGITLIFYGLCENQKGAHLFWNCYIVAHSCIFRWLYSRCSFAIKYCK